MARPHRYAKRCGLEYWSVGVLREVRIAPRGRGVGGAEGAAEWRFYCGIRAGLVSIPARENGCHADNEKDEFCAILSSSANSLN
jgi:hypothetical protein